MNKIADTATDYSDKPMEASGNEKVTVENFRRRVRRAGDGVVDKW